MPNALERTEFTAGIEEIERKVWLDPKKYSAKVGHTDIVATSVLELKSQLTAAIYSHFHIRNPEAKGAGPQSEQNLREALIERIPHATHQQQIQLLSSQNHVGNESVTVGINGLKVVVPSRSINRDRKELPTVRLPSWRSNTTPGYLLALSDIAFPRNTDITRVYIPRNSPADTFDVWSSILNALNRAGIPYHLKALSSASSYPRSDALVLYVRQVDLGTATGLLNAIPQFGYETGSLHSIFTQPVGKNLAVAEEPQDFRPSYRSLSFGQHRSRVLADALLATHTESCALEQSWVEETLKAGINADHPAYNRV